MKSVFYVLAVIVAGAELCSGQTVLNGSFEAGATPPFGGAYVPAPNSITISGWTVQSGSVDYIGNDTWQAAAGSRSLDMSGHDAGTIMQNISGFTPGHQYRLSFYMAGNNDGSPTVFHLQAKIGSVTQAFAFDATGHTYSNMGWSLRTMDFTANNTTMALTFTSLDDGNAGPALDNVSISTAPEPCVPAPDGLISWWRGENSTADAADGNNGTIAGTGTVTYGPGVVGQAFVFDGTHRDRVNIGNPTNLRLEDFTLEAWVKRSSPTVTSFDVLGADGSVAGDGAVIFGYGRGGYVFALANNGRMIVSRTDIDGVISAPLVTDTNWHHLAVTKSGSTAVFYLDGVPQATPAYAHPAPYTFDDATCTCSAAASIGSRGDGRGGTFFGMIDEPAVFNRALTATEIQAIYAAGSAGKCVPASTPANLINVNFGAHLNPGSLSAIKVGLAATGATTNDFWNFYSRDGNNDFDWLVNSALPNLKLADGTPTAAGLVVHNAPGCWSNGSSDPMYNSYIYPFDGGNVTVTVTNLPAGQYDVLAYANDGNYEVVSGGVSQGVQHTLEPTRANPPVWTQGVQYARFTNVNVSAGQPLVLTVRPGIYGYAIISGMQIAASNSTNNPPPPACVPAPAGQVSWWRAEGNALDVIGNANGTFTDPNFSVGEVGTAFDFNGGNNVVIADQPSLNPMNAITLECWVYARRLTTSYAQDLVSKDAELAGPRQYELTMGPPPGLDGGTGGFRAHVGVPSAGGGLVFIDGSTKVQTNTWYHVAMTYDGAALKLYVNGNLDAQKAVTGPIITTPEPVRIGGGAPAGNPPYFFNGLIDEVSLYSRALNPSDIQAIYAAGGAGKCTTLPPVNHPPVADATATKPLLIVPAGCRPTVVLDGSRSSDPDADTLQYRWFKTGEASAFATGVVAMVTLPPGAHSITLVVDDGLASDAQTFAVELITPAQAVERLITSVNSQAQKPHPLVATLSAALASIERCNVTPAINQLEAFQNKVRAQVAPDDPALAGQFSQAAQDIINALSRGCASAKPHGKIGKLHRYANGKVRMEFSAPNGPAYLIEASTNLVDWETIGVAVEFGPGEFEFEDSDAARLPARFYRLVAP